MIVLLSATDFTLNKPIVEIWLFFMG